jgi:transcriptional regulator with XRE-family HTH domain
MLNHPYLQDNQILEFFGKRLRSARQAANLSQKGLAQRLHIGQDTVSNYEQGKVVPGILMVFQLAQVLCVDVGYFFPDERFPNLSEADRETLALMTSLSPNAYEFVLAFVRYFIRSQQHRRYLSLGLDPQKCLEKFLERDLYALEQTTLAVCDPSHPDEAVPPIYALVGFTSLLLMGIQAEKMDAASEALFQRIAANGNRLTALVRELMRAEGGRNS